MCECGNTIGNQRWGPWATVGLGAVVGLVFLMTQIVVGVVLFFSRYSFEATENIDQLLPPILAEGSFLALATCATTVVCVGTVLGFIRLRKCGSIVDYLALVPFRKKGFLIYAGITTGLLVVFSLIDWAVGRPFVNEFMLEAFNSRGPELIFWAAIVIGAPLFEEVFFRGFLFEGLRQSRVGAYGAIGLTAVAWTAIHPQYDMFELVGILILGVVFGLARLKTGSLWSPLILHAAWNLIALVQTGIYVRIVGG